MPTQNESNFNKPLLNRARRRDVSADVPDEAGELARDRRTSLVLMQAARAQSPIAGAQAQLRLPSDVDDALRQSFQPRRNGFPDSRAGGRKLRDLLNREGVGRAASMWRR